MEMGGRMALARCVVDVGRCWRMVYDRNLQSDHCYEAPSWTG